jgi:hypothetical protein
MPLTPDQFIAQKRKSLLLAPRQLAVVRWPFAASPITSLHTTGSTALTLPTGGFTIGLHAKKTGGKLANDQTINDIESHGVGGPVRQIATKRVINLGFEPQETHRHNLEHYWGTDFSGVVPDTAGGVTLQVSDLPSNTLHKVALIGKDDFNGQAVYICWIGNRVNISKTDAASLTDAEVATYPMTLNFQTDDVTGTPLIIDIFGPGWTAIQSFADAAFGFGTGGS